MNHRRRTLLPSLKASNASSSTAKATPSLAVPPASTFPRSGNKLTRVLSPRSASSPTPNPESEPFSHDAWSTMDQQDEPETDMDRITQPVMTKLLSDTLHGLPASFNPLIMRIVESHTTLRLENKRLRAQIDDSHQTNRNLSSKHRQDAAHWLLRELEYEKTIKNLHTRLDSQAQLSVDASSSQPANEARHPPVSASSIRQDAGGPIEGGNRQNSLRRPSAVTTGTKTARRKIPSPLYAPQNRGHETGNGETSPKGRPSHDSLSTFSGADTLSDDESASPDVTIDQDFASIRRLAEIMARRRGFTLEKTLTQLTNTFYGEGPTTPVTAIKTAPSPHSSVDTDQASTLLEATTKLRAPQSQSLIAAQHAHARSDGRTFSFNPGDDSSFASQMLDTLKRKENTNNPTDSPVSTSSPLRFKSSKPEDCFSPTRSGAMSAGVEKLPPTSPTVRSPGAGSIKSRIPSPAYNSWSAVSRDRRGKSSSSVTTAIRHSTPLESNDSVLGGDKSLEKRSTGSDSN